MNKPYIVGIAGGSGSGKTFFLKRFLDHFTADEVCLVSQDDYYIPVAHNMTAEENKLYNFDLPATVDHEHFEDDINKLLNRQTIFKKEYTFNNPNAVPKTLEIKSAPILIVEGLFILHFRGIANDDALYKWINHVVPAYKEFLLPYKNECDLVITNNGHTAEDILLVTEKISRELREKVLS